MNPFPAMGIPEEAPVTTADRQEIISRFKDCLRITLFEKKSTITLVTGDYGAGKSHLLKYFKYRVNTQLLSSKNRAIAIYVKSAGRNFKDLYLYFIDDIGREFLSSYSMEMVRAFVAKNPSDTRKHVYGKELANEKDLSHVNTDRLLKNLLFYDFMKALRDSVSTSTHSIINPLLCLAHPDYSSVAWRWFIGETLTKDERELIRVDYNIEDAKDAQAAFKSLITLFTQSGTTATVLLIDEFERFTLLPKNRRDEYMDEIRHFIDDNPSGLCLVITTTPTAYKELTETPSALTRRIAGAEFELRFFKRDDIEELIARYVSLGRAQNADMKSVLNKHPTSSPFLYPFTKEAVERIDRRSKGLVSTVINLCRESIEIAVGTDLEIIDQKVVNAVSL
jgi:archaellum biogenesis ATPase FlaH